MAISSERLTYLIHRYSADECTIPELQELLKGIEESEGDDALNSALQAEWDSQSDLEVPPVIDKESIYAQIIRSASIGKSSRIFPRWTRVAAAASFIILMGGAALLYRTHPPHPTTATVQPLKVRDVAPGGNKAMLTLANGSRIVLDSVRNGDLPPQGSSRLYKADDGKLVYQTRTGDNKEATAGANVSGIAAKAVTFNTIATPIGGQYQVTLADGTKVWLNALSSLRFPTAFKGKDRAVELSGEAYFEVAAQQSPFKVHIVTPGKRPMEIDVLGTHFDVDAYGDDPLVTTTLLEGRVKIIAGNKDMILAPGQQGRLDQTGGLRLETDADAEEAIAWKNGYFQFTDAEIPTVMRQISRWYGIQVEYEGSMPDRQFGGQMQRSAYLSKVLQVLAESGVHFKIEGNKVVISQ